LAHPSGSHDLFEGVLTTTVQRVIYIFKKLLRMIKQWQMKRRRR